MLTLAVIFVVMLSVLVFAAKSYQFASSSAESSSNSRAVLSYITSCVHGSNAASVSIEERGGTECLVITDRDGFEQCFFEKDGMLMEMYGEAGAEMQTGDALEIGEAGDLSFSMEDNGLLAIRTGEGTSYVCVERQGY